APAELDFEGGDRRRFRGRRAPAPRVARERAAPERHGARPASHDKTSGDVRPQRERPAQTRGAAEPVALFAQPAAKPAAEPRTPAQPDRRVVGFGDDLPAFLARAPRVAARA